MGWLISHTYIMPYISIECNLKDMNTNLAKAVNTYVGLELALNIETYHLH